MKSDGVAWASVLAQYSGLILAALFLFSRYKNYVRIISFNKALQWQALKRFFIVNSDIFIRTLLLILTLTFFTSQSAKISDEILAINTLLFQFFFIFSYFLDGFAFAGEALVGKFKGAADNLQLKLGIQKLFQWNWGMSIIAVFLFYLFTQPILNLLTSDAKIIQTALEYRYWVILLPLTSGAAFIWDGIYIGVTASKAMRNTMIVSSLLIFLPAYYLSLPYMGNHSLWFALNVFMLSRSLLMWIMAPSAVFK